MAGTTATRSAKQAVKNAPVSATLSFEQLLQNTIEASRGDGVDQEEAMGMLEQGKKCLIILDETQTVTTVDRKGYALGKIMLWGHSLTISTKAYDEETGEAVNEPGTFVVDSVSASIWNDSIRLTAWV